MGEAGQEMGCSAVSVIKSNARAQMSSRLRATLIAIHQCVSRAVAGTQAQQSHLHNDTLHPNLA